MPHALSPSARPSWRHPPWLTLALIVVNLWVFWALQRSEVQSQARAAQFYLQSEVLPALELPAYLDWLDQHHLAYAGALRQALNDGRPQAVLQAMTQDTPFLQRLRSGAVIAPAHPQHAAWQRARADYDAMLQPPVITRWSTDQHPGAVLDPVTWLTSAFLHIHVERLLVNMLFLLLLGAVLEPALGRPTFLVFYLLGAGSASALANWAHANQGGLSLGAAGAVSALVGVYLVLQGRRRTGLPGLRGRAWLALALLPLGWVLARLLLQWRGPPGPSFIADLGGLLMGMLLMTLALALRRIEAPEDLARQAGTDPHTPTLLAAHAAQVAAARRLTGELQFEQAAAAWRAAAKLRPRDAETLRQWFNLAKLWPADENFHRCARLIFALTGEDAYTLTLQHTTFRTYQGLAKPGVRLHPDTMVRLTRRFTRGGEFADADQLCRALLRTAPAHPALTETLSFFMQGLMQTGHHERARAWLPELQRLAPDSPLVRQIRQTA